MSNVPVSSRVLEAAIAWKLSLGDSSSTPDERNEFMRWHAASEEHARAWRQLGAMDQRVSAAAGPARQALLQSRASLRRRIGKVGGGLAGTFLLGALLAWGGAPSLAPSYWLADQRTATGELRTLRLEDGTLLSLNTHTAVDIDYAGEQRVCCTRAKSRSKPATRTRARCWCAPTTVACGHWAHASWYAAKLKVHAWKCCKPRSPPCRITAATNTCCVKASKC